MANPIEIQIVTKAAKRLIHATTAIVTTSAITTINAKIVLAKSQKRKQAMPQTKIKKKHHVALATMANVVVIVNVIPTKLHQQNQLFKTIKLQAIQM